MSNTMEIAKVYYRNQKMIELSGRLIQNAQRQNYYNVAQNQKEMIQCFSEWLENLPAEQEYFSEKMDSLQEDVFVKFLQTLLDAQEQKDYILYADMLEMQLLPFLKDLQEIILEREGMFISDEKVEKTDLFLQRFRKLYDTLQKIPEPDAEEYQIVPAQSGKPSFCIKMEHGNYYLHSNVDPVVEAEQVVQEYFECDCEHYIVYGLGLGYHIAALNRRCMQSARIDVYESDLNVIKMASIYGLPEEMLTENVHIYHDIDCSEIAHAMQEDSSVLFLHYPSVRNIRNEDIRKSFHKFMVKESGIRNNKERMYINFKGNCKYCNQYIDVLQKRFDGKDVYLVAAGPSLDNNVALLKKKKRNSLILSVGTTFHKLIDMGIRPDYVIFLDPGERIYGHIKGLEEQTVPIIVASTAYRGIAQHYKGPVYMVCQEGYAPAEELAKENGFHLYQSGGSVSTIAMDVAIRLGAARVICLGLDLAYTNDATHASDTMDYTSCAASDEYKVKAFDGGTVNSSNLFIVYREWIEQRIQREKECRFINATEGGAYIEGMQHMSLKEAMKGKKT